VSATGSARRHVVGRAGRRSGGLGGKELNRRNPCTMPDSTDEAHERVLKDFVGRRVGRSSFLCGARTRKTAA
jgi:hypothetical protein